MKSDEKHEFKKGNYICTLELLKNVLDIQLNLPCVNKYTNTKQYWTAKYVRDKNTALRD